MPDAPAANRWTWLISLSPALNSALSALVGIAMGVSGYAGLQGLKAPAEPMVIKAANAPKVTAKPPPVGCAQDFLDLDTKAAAIRNDLAMLRQLIEERFPAPTPRVAPSKARVWK